MSKVERVYKLHCREMRQSGMRSCNLDAVYETKGEADAAKAQHDAEFHGG